MLRESLILNFLNKNGTLERSLTGKDSFVTIKDFEVDNIENTYVMNNTNDVYVFKQQRLLQEK